ncbi:MAG: hypothetical protein WC632_04165 [Candidatus Margulisiibacteriota bacterium]
MQKSFVTLGLIALSGLMLLTGCQTATSPAATSIPTTAAAQSIGLLCKDGLAIDNGIIGIFSSALSANGVKAATVTDITYGSDGWWSATNTYTTEAGGVLYSFDYSYKFRVWNSAGTEIVTQGALDAADDTNISTLEMVVTFAYGSGSTTSTYKFGLSTSDPMTISGYGSTSKTIDGTISYAGSYNSESYEVTITYNTLTMSSSGYPSGSVTWEMKTNGTTVYAGTITYDGTRYATCTFSTGGSGSYTIDLLDGSVS